MLVVPPTAWNLLLISITHKAGKHTPRHSQCRLVLQDPKHILKTAVQFAGDLAAQLTPHAGNAIDAMALNELNY
jgi:hypothetical protein